MTHTTATKIIMRSAKRALARRASNRSVPVPRISAATERMLSIVSLPALPITFSRAGSKPSRLWVVMVSSSSPSLPSASLLIVWIRARCSALSDASWSNLERTSDSLARPASNGARYLSSPVMMNPRWPVSASCNWSNARVIDRRHHLERMIDVVAVLFQQAVVAERDNAAEHQGDHDRRCADQGGPGHQRL
jgi:hypothetical protein